MVYQTLEGLINALPYIGLAIGLIVGIPFLIWIIYKLLKTYVVIGGIQKVKEREDYKNLEWLNHHYSKLGWSMQDIANDQGVSMITIKKWIDKLKHTSSESAVLDQEISERKEEKIYCAHCGQINTNKFNFCISCGKPL